MVLVSYKEYTDIPPGVARIHPSTKWKVGDMLWLSSEKTRGVGVEVVQMAQENVDILLHPQDIEAAGLSTGKAECISETKITNVWERVAIFNTSSISDAVLGGAIRGRLLCSHGWIPIPTSNETYKVCEYKVFPVENAEVLGWVSTATLVGAVDLAPARSLPWIDDIDKCYELGSVQAVESTVLCAVRKQSSLMLVLQGPKGTGKSTLVQAICERENVVCIMVTLADRCDWKVLMQRAFVCHPCILLVRGGQGWNGPLPPLPLGVCMVLSTNTNPPWKGDLHVDLDYPCSLRRQDILLAHARSLPCDKICWDNVLSGLHGFSGADIAKLCRSAHVNALEDQRTSVSEVDFMSALSAAPLPHVLQSEWGQGLKIPSGETWVKARPLHKVGGLWSARNALQEVLDRFTTKEFMGSCGILLWGPSGCGKSTLAWAFARSAKATVFHVTVPWVRRRYVGEGQHAVAHLFHLAHAAQPSLLIFDPIDALFPCREEGKPSRVLSQLIMELDALPKEAHVLVVATASKPSGVDPALLRPGRIQTHIPIKPLKSLDERVDVLYTLLSPLPLEPISDGPWKEETAITKIDMHLLSVSWQRLVVGLAQRCEGMSVAELCGRCKAASATSMTRCVEQGLAVCIRAHDLWEGVGWFV